MCVCEACFFQVDETLLLLDIKTKLFYGSIAITSVIEDIMIGLAYNRFSNGDESARETLAY